MRQSIEIANAARTVRVLHGALVGGLLTVGTILLLLRSASGGAAILPSPPISIGFGVLAIVLVAVATRVFSRLVGQRAREQTPDAFWSDLHKRNGAILLWGTLEGAALLGVVGYFLTGRLAPLAAFAVAVGALILMRPGRFENEAA